MMLRGEIEGLKERLREDARKVKKQVGNRLIRLKN
jgi:hypothetical protein